MSAIRFFLDCAWLAPPWQERGEGGLPDFPPHRMVWGFAGPGRPPDGGLRPTLNGREVRLLRLREGVKLRFLDIEVGVNVLDVVVVFQFFHEPQHLLGFLAA